MCVVLSTAVSVETAFFSGNICVFGVLLLLLQIPYCTEWQVEIEISCQSSKFPIESQLLKLNLRHTELLNGLNCKDLCYKTAIEEFFLKNIHQRTLKTTSVRSSKYMPEKREHYI